MNRIANLLFKNRYVKSSHDYLASITSQLALSLNSRSDVLVKDKHQSSNAIIRNGPRRRNLSWQSWVLVGKKSSSRPAKSDHRHSTLSKKHLGFFGDFLNTSSMSGYTKSPTRTAMDRWSKDTKKSAMVASRMGRPAIPAPRFETKRLKIDEDMVKLFVADKSYSPKYKLHNLNSNYLLGDMEAKRQAKNLTARKRNPWKTVPYFSQQTIVEDYLQHLMSNGQKETKKQMLHARDDSSNGQVQTLLPRVHETTVMQDHLRPKPAQNYPKKRFFCQEAGPKPKWLMMAEDYFIPREACMYRLPEEVVSESAANLLIASEPRFFIKKALNRFRTKTSDKAKPQVVDNRMPGGKVKLNKKGKLQVKGKSNMKIQKAETDIAPVIQIPPTNPEEYRYTDNNPGFIEGVPETRHTFVQFFEDGKFVGLRPVSKMLLQSLGLGDFFRHNMDQTRFYIIIQQIPEIRDTSVLADRTIKFTGPYGFPNQPYYVILGEDDSMLCYASGDLIQDLNFKQLRIPSQLSPAANKFLDYTATPTNESLGRMIPMTAIPYQVPYANGNYGTPYPIHNMLVDIKKGSEGERAEQKTGKNDSKSTKEESKPKMKSATIEVAPSISTVSSVSGSKEGAVQKEASSKEDQKKNPSKIKNVEVVSLADEIAASASEQATTAKEEQEGIANERQANMKAMNARHHAMQNVIVTHAKHQNLKDAPQGMAPCPVICYPAGELGERPCPVICFPNGAPFSQMGPCEPVPANHLPRPCFSYRTPTPFQTPFSPNPFAFSVPSAEGSTAYEPQGPSPYAGTLESIPPCTETDTTAYSQSTPSYYPPSSPSYYPPSSTSYYPPSSPAYDTTYETSPEESQTTFGYPSIGTLPCERYSTAYSSQGVPTPSPQYISQPFEGSPINISEGPPTYVGPPATGSPSKFPSIPGISYCPWPSHLVCPKFPSSSGPPIYSEPQKGYVPTPVPTSPYSSGDTSPVGPFESPSVDEETESSWTSPTFSYPSPSYSSFETQGTPTMTFRSSPSGPTFGSERSSIPSCDSYFRSDIPSYEETSYVPSSGTVQTEVPSRGQWTTTTFEPTTFVSTPQYSQSTVPTTAPATHWEIPSTQYSQSTVPTTAPATQWEVPSTQYSQSGVPTSASATQWEVPSTQYIQSGVPTTASGTPWEVPSTQNSQSWVPTTSPATQWEVPSTQYSRSRIPTFGPTQNSPAVFNASISPSPNPYPPSSDKCMRCFPVRFVQVPAGLRSKLLGSLNSTGFIMMPVSQANGLHVTSSPNFRVTINNELSAWKARTGLPIESLQSFLTVLSPRTYSKSSDPAKSPPMVQKISQNSDSPDENSNVSLPCPEISPSKRALESFHMIEATTSDLQPNHVLEKNRNLPKVRIPKLDKDQSMRFLSFRSVEDDLKKADHDSKPNLNYIERQLAAILTSLGIEKVAKSSYDGHWLGSGSVIGTIDPAMNCKLADVILPTMDEINSCIQSAKDASKVWMKFQAPCRSIILREIADAISKRREELAKLISLEVGKVKIDADCEVRSVINMFEYAAGLAAVLQGNLFESERTDHIILERFHPMGVTGIISAFNTPFSTFAKSAAISLAVGNSVIFKPAPTTILTSIALIKVITEVVKRFNLPPIVTCVQGGADVGRKLASDERIDVIAFSGKSENGHDVGMQVQDRFGKSLLNLCGTNGMIVNHDANFELALKAATLGIVDFAGQKKQKISHIIVHRLLYDQFVEEMSKRLNKVTKFCGHPMDQRSIFGSLHTDRITHDFLETLNRVRDSGGIVRVGGKQIASNYVAPALVTGLGVESELMKKPVVGPISFILPASDFEEAVEINNSFANRLQSSLFTKSILDVYKYIGPSGLSGGVISINTANTGTELTVPLGGDRAAGGGRLSGSDVWREYCRRVAINLNFSSNLPYAHGSGCMFVDKLKHNKI